MLSCVIIGLAKGLVFASLINSDFYAKQSNVKLAGLAGCFWLSPCPINGSSYILKVRFDSVSSDEMVPLGIWSDLVADEVIPVPKPSGEASEISFQGPADFFGLFKLFVYMLLYSEAGLLRSV